MSDNIPFEIQSEIMKRLPVKSLIQFRSVCKPWKSLIDSSHFILHHVSQQQHLLVRYNEALTFEDKYVSIVDDDHTFPQQQVAVTIPIFVASMRKHYMAVDSSHGLLCVFIVHQQKAIIWNPSIRKAVDVNVPNMADYKMYKTVLGFGVCRETTDPKIVKITIDMKSVNPWRVEVFMLSSKAWRGSYSGNMPHKPTRFSESQVVVDGVVYWLANDRVDGGGGSYNLIVSFDLTSEEFGEVNLPHRLAALDNPQCSLSMDKLRESLVVVEPGVEDFNLVYHVWMMKVGVPKLFKLYTISSHTPDVLPFFVRGFRKTGEPLIEVILMGHHDPIRTLVAYDPYSKSISNIVGISEISFTCFVYSYMETLLLL